MTLSSVFVVWNSLRLRGFSVPATHPADAIAGLAEAGQMTFGSCPG